MQRQEVEDEIGDDRVDLAPPPAGIQVCDPFEGLRGPVEAVWEGGVGFSAAQDATELLSLGLCSLQRRLSPTNRTRRSSSGTPSCLLLR